MGTEVKSRQRAADEGCIWMKSGVTDYKLCNNSFDCTTCRYDQTMKETAVENKRLQAAGTPATGKRAGIISWQDALRAKPATRRVCRHTLTGRIGYRLCAYDYNCHACDFDQFFEDDWEISIPIQLVDVPRIRGYKVPEGFYYHDGHAWAKIENAGRVRVGLDDFGMKVVGPLDKLELPHIGYEVTKNSASWSLYRQDNEAKIMSPIDGVVVAVNPKVRRQPDISLKEPYEDGWVFMVQAAELKKNIKELHFGEEARDFIESESDQLFKMVEAEVGPLPADGGQIVTDVYGNLPALGWDNLTKTFFRT
jgi:glycine cleavage system H lipoate-binding protein